MSENPERPQDAVNPVPASAGEELEALPSGPTERLSEDLEVPASTPTLELGAVGAADSDAGSSLTHPEGGAAAAVGATPSDRSQAASQGPAQAESQTPSQSASQAGDAADEPARARHRATERRSRSGEEDPTSVRRRSLFRQSTEPAEGEPAPDSSAGPSAGASPSSSPAASPAADASADAPGPLRPVWHSRTGGQPPRPSQPDASEPHPRSGSGSPAARPAGPAPFPQAPPLTTPVLPASTETSPAWAGTPTPPRGQSTGFSPRSAPAPAATTAQAGSDAEALLAIEAEQSQLDEDALLAGSVVVGKPASRVAAHWLGVLLSIVLLPAAWFLLHDGAAHLRQGLSPYELGTSGRGLATLAGGCLVMVVALWTARRSSLGTFVVGIPTALAGLPALLLPSLVGDYLTPLLERVASQSALGQTLADALWTDVTSGRLLIAGLGLIMVGVVSHSTRRAGRREQLVISRGRAR